MIKQNKEEMINDKTNNIMTTLICSLILLGLFYCMVLSILTANCNLDHWYNDAACPTLISYFPQATLIIVKIFAVIAVIYFIFIAIKHIVKTLVSKRYKQ